jgi:8-oxo-dGTP pyrophosphatase MutT (NUDIX family)
MASAYCVFYAKGAITAVLVVRKAANMPNNPGQLAFPGGRTNHGETATAAACRECYEETGVTVNVGASSVHTGLREFTISASHVKNFVGYSSLYVRVPSTADLTSIRWDIEANLTAGNVHDKELTGADVLTALHARSTFIREHDPSDERLKTEWFTQIAQSVNLT